MRHFFRVTSLSLFTIILSLMVTLPVLAVPSLPSSFYGTIKVNNSIVPDGTLIQASIGGQVYAEAFTQTFQGDSVYALDVRGDDTDTAAQDGGRENDTIQFSIGGVLANQTGVWHTGTNVNLNLTAVSSTPLATPHATPSPVPTQTTIPTRQPTPVPITPTPVPPTATSALQSSPVPSSTGQAALSPTATIQVSQGTAIHPPQPLPTSTRQLKTSQTPADSEKSPAGGSNNTMIIVVASILGLLVVAMVAYEYLAPKKPKV
jgi:hypothetical protein